MAQETKERTHKQQIEEARADYVTPYENINNLTFKGAWAHVAEMSGLSHTPPQNIPEAAQKAIVILAKRVMQLEREWS